MSGSLRVRPSPIAGSWYPGNPETLASSIDALISAAPPASLAGELVGLLAPHAGHRYSGAVAAAAFRLLYGTHWDLLLLLGPSHRVPAGNGLLVADAEAYQTPLGELPIALDQVRALASTLPLRLLQHDQEHSLEILLPFLQRVLDPLPPLLPLMLGAPNMALATRLADTLASQLAGLRVLLVLSSDWSHYYADQQARRLDEVGIDCLLRLDVAGLALALAQARTQACGAGALLAGLELARRWQVGQASLLAYATSGDITGDYSRVVGYASAALLRGGAHAS